MSYPGTPWAPQEAGWYLFDTSGVDYRAYVTDDFLNCPPRDCSDVYEQHQAWDYWSANPAGTTSTGIIPPPNGVDHYLFRWVSRTTFPSYVRPDSAVQPWTGAGPQAGPPIIAHIGWGTGVVTDSNGDPVGVGSPEPGIGIATSDPIAVQNWLNCQINQLRWACPDPNYASVPGTQGTGSGGTGGYIGDGDSPSGPGDRACDFGNNPEMTWAAVKDIPEYQQACEEAWAAAFAAGVIGADGLPTDAEVAAAIGNRVLIRGYYLADEFVIDALSLISGPDWAQSWSKVKTSVFSTAHGTAVIHFYKDASTGDPWYGKGLKLVFDNPF